MLLVKSDREEIFTYAKSQVRNKLIKLHHITHLPLVILHLYCLLLSCGLSFSFFVHCNGCSFRYQSCWVGGQFAVKTVCQFVALHFYSFSLVINISSNAISNTPGVCCSQLVHCRTTYYDWSWEYYKRIWQLTKGEIINTHCECYKHDFNFSDSLKNSKTFFHSWIKAQKIMC